MDAPVQQPKLTSFARRCLVMQGFGALSNAELRLVSGALRFTPAVCAILVILGLALRSPTLLLVLAAMGWLGAAFARGNPVDWSYSLVVRPLFGGAKLPPNPSQRRFACGIGGTLAAGAGAAFLVGLNGLAYVLGGFVVAASLLVALTHWCLASWMYGLMFGKPKSAGA